MLTHGKLDIYPAISAGPLFNGQAWLPEAENEIALSTESTLLTLSISILAALTTPALVGGRVSYAQSPVIRDCRFIRLSRNFAIHGSVSELNSGRTWANV